MAIRNRIKAVARMPKSGEKIEFCSDQFTDKGPATGEIVDWKTTVDGNYVTVKFGDEQESFSWDDLNADVRGKLWMVGAGFTIEEKLERLRIRRGDPVGTDYITQLAVQLQSPKGVLMRIFKTIEPSAKVAAPAYPPDICHGVVAKAIMARGNNPELKIWLYGGKNPKGDFVQHSVLSDENNRVVKDPWRSTDGHKWHKDKGYGRPGDMLDFILVETVGGLYDEFGT